MQRCLQSRKSKCERPVALGGSMDLRMRRAVRAGERTGRGAVGVRERLGRLCGLCRLCSAMGRYLKFYKPMRPVHDWI